MNARSFIFLICTTLTFFFVHYYFDSKHEEKILKEHNQKKIEMTQSLERIEKNNPFTSKDLNEVALYKDTAGESLFSYATQVDDSFLLLTDKKYPDALYVKSGKELKKVILLSSASENSPALYGHSTPLLQVPSYSEKDTFYFLSTLEKDALAIAKIKDKRVFTNQKTANDAIAFIKVDTKYLPVAIYDHHSEKLRPLKDYFSIRDFITEKKIVYSQESSNEEFYVLENDYQQLVFSTKGGALAEINLPLKNDTNNKSYIHSVEIDTIMDSKHPENNLFPQKPYYTFKDGKQVKIEKGSQGGYYPAIRRSTYYKNGQVKKKLDSKYYAYNIISEDEDIEHLSYEVVRFEKDLIEFESVQPFRKITKTFTLAKEDAPYCFNLSIKIDGPVQGLYLSSGVPEVELQSGSFTPFLKYQTIDMGKSVVDSVSLPEKRETTDSISANWICNSNGFVGTIINPLSEIEPGYRIDKIDGKLVPTRLTSIDSTSNLYPAEKYPGYLCALPVKDGEMTLRAFSGPFQKSLLKNLDRLFANNEESVQTDYAAIQNSGGWFSFITVPFGKFLFFLMEFFYTLTSSWGLSIILLTLALKIMLYPLNAWAIKGQQKQKATAPKIQAIQEKYKKDPKRMQMEMMKIYREQGGSPLAGCLPLLIQMPFLFGMFSVLRNAVELRGASFIPGWITNLAQPDVLFSWNFHIPLIGSEFHLLPIINGFVIYLQQKITIGTTQPKPTKGSDQEKSQKMMAFLPIFLTFIFYNMPSGLNIYFISSTVLGIIQHMLMQKKTAQK